jgi:CHAD domain-containing protein
MALSTFFYEKFHKTLLKVNKSLDTYLANPEDEENVHDVRTSLRRLDTFYSLLPKKLRKRNRKLIEKYKEFFKANSKIRDLDIIRNEVAALAQGEPDAPKLVLQLQRKRKTELGHGMKLAKMLKKVSSIKVKGAPSNKIESRIDNKIDRFSIRIKEVLPAILLDGTKKDEIHNLRKYCKKLRYIFEAMPDNDSKKYRKKIEGAILGKDLEEIQVKLGAIHDSDISIEYLQKKKSKFVKKLVVKESGVRDHLYQEFIKYMKE